MPITGSQKALMYARSGIMRAGASRSGYFQSYLLVKINGTDRTAKVDKGTLSIDYQLGRQPDTGRFRVTGIDVAAGQSFTVCDGAADNRVYAGTVQAAHQVSVRANAAKSWDIDLIDWTFFLNRRRAIKTYPAGTLANLAVADLVTTYSSGFSIAKVRSGAPALTGDMVFRGVPISDAIGQIADAVGWKVYPDADQVVHFFSTETEQAPTALQVGTYTYENLDYSLDISQIRTRMYGVGGGAATTAPVAVGATTIAVDECGWYAAVGGQILADSNVITYTGVSATSGPGTVTGCSGITMAVLQGVTCNVFVQLDDATAQTALAALEGGDGIHEGWIEDGRWSLATTTYQAQAVLTAFKSQDVRGTYTSRDRFTAVGKLVTINLPGRSINTTVTLQRVNRRLEFPLGRAGTGYASGWIFAADFSVVWSDLVDLLTGAVQAA